MMPHLVDILSPPTETDSRGQTVGSPRVIKANVPCSIDTLSGREAEVAHKLVGTATHTVKMFGPIVGLNDKCKLGELPKDGAGNYKSHLEIGHVHDPTRTGREYTLLVTEVVG